MNEENRLCLHGEIMTCSLTFPPTQNSLISLLFFSVKADGQEEHRLTTPTPAEEEYGTVAFDKKQYFVSKIRTKQISHVPFFCQNFQISLFFSQNKQKQLTIFNEIRLRERN